MTSTDREAIAKKAAQLREIEEKMRNTRDSGTTLLLARDLRKTTEELRDLTRRRHLLRMPRKD